MENIGDISSVSKMEKQSVVLGNQNGETVAGAAPALYVLVKQSTGKFDEGALVSNQDDCGLASCAAQPVSKVKTILPAERTSGSIIVTLDNSNMWNEFYHRNTEMILTKQGRRMFPYCRYWISGLDSDLKYILVMDISPVDNFRYKWNGNSWEPSGKAEPHVLGRVFIHPESPSTGYYWMQQPVSFYKLKVTNNTLDQEGHIILHSMHRYLPRLHLVPADQATDVIQLNGPDVHTFTFPQTEFFAVTAYQNIQITQLKIDYNPFAKGFRDDGLSSRLQRDAKQNGSSEQEVGSLTSSPSNHKYPKEGDTLNPEQKALDRSFGDTCNTHLEKQSLSPYHDFLGFVEADVHGCNGQALKQETSESPIASQNVSHAASPLNSNGSVEVKEEPVDDYDYVPSVSVEGISVKQEDDDNVAEEYLNSSDSGLERQLKKQSGVDKKESGSNKRPHDGQLGVARAKMLKLDNGKLPVVYLEPCAVTRNTVKVSALSPVMVSPSKGEQSPLSHSVESFPTLFENSVISSPFEAMETDEIPTGKQIPEDNVSQRCSVVREMLWENNETSSNLASENNVPSCNVKTSAYSDPSLAKVNSTGKKSNTLRNSISCKNITDNRNIGLPGQRKRGRPRKIKHLGVGRPPKCTGRLITTSNYASLEPHGIHLDVKPDLVDVDGVLFVSFASKEALDIHSVDRTEEKELKNTQTTSLTTCDPCVDQGVQMIQQLEKELLEDLKSFKYRQEIHPSLREVGLKLNSVDPAMSIDLKYLGVQLPLSYSDHYTSWKNSRGSSSSADTGVPFVSRTGKTNDFTKIKGWREKLHSSSKSEGIIIEGSLKNRSAFCSDKLDEYLETEGKLLETSMGLSPSTSNSPVVYQLPTKSTSYVRTLDSVLKKQSITTSSSYNFKRLSMPSVSKRKRRKIKNRKQAIPKSKEKSLPVVRKQKRNLPVLEEKVTSSQPSKQGANEAEALPAIEESMQGKQITVRQPQQQPQQTSRLPSLSKTQLRLMDLEDYALWDGKPRTYITEERADLSLTTLLTAQASLKNKPIHKIMKRRAPPCNNEFCRLGCICSSLALEKRQPAHCRKPECMFGCTCLKRKVVLVKGGLKKKTILEKPLQGRQKLHCGEKLDQQEQDTEKEKEEDKLNGKDKKRKTKMEYTICDTEPEEPVKNFPLWVKIDGELDPEPIYIPTPSAVEPTKPVMPPDPEVLPCDDKPAADEVKLATGVKPTRVYTPRPNPVIREEDKDPVYLYFESMMTCARVRTYTRKTQEKERQQKCLPSSEKHIEKEHHPELQPIKREEDKEPGEKNCWFSCSAEDPAISYVHHTTPDGRTKLVEIVSDCSWEEDRNEILNTLSQHIKNKMPKSLKVGNFIIDLESEGKTWGEKNIPICTSRVKISMLSCENQSEKDQTTILETSDLSSYKKIEKNKSLTPGMLREQRKKGLPFYAGLSSAGKLFAYTCKSGLDPSSLIQVNGKNYPQAKLLLGQMGALHPASRLAAYLTGRLRPAMLDLSTISTVISKMASSTKVATSESQSAETPASETLKTTFLDNTTLNSTLTPRNAKANASAQRQIAIRPLLDGVTSQLVVSAVGALQQKIPGIRTPQPLTGPQKFNIRSTPLSSGTATVPAAATTTITVASLPVTTPSPSQCKKAISTPGIAMANATETPENSIVSVATPAVTVKISKSTGIVTPVATIAFTKSAITTSAPVLTASLSTVSPTTASIATVTTPTSLIGCVGSGPLGIHKSPLSNEKPGTTSPPNFPPGAEKRMGPRLLLIPVHSGSPTLRPQNMQLAQGKRMILQPIRNPGGVNLYRHPNGQIIQLVPLHQLQTTGSQPNLPPVMLQNSGSVVGIRLPTPSKTPETSVCQASPVSSVIQATTATSVLSVTPTFSEYTTTETTSVLPETSTTIPASLLPSTTTIEVPSMSLPLAVVSTPPTIEAASLLSIPCTSDMPLLPISSFPTSVPPTSKGLSVVTVPSISDVPLVLPIPPPTVSASSVTEATSVLPKQPTTEDPSVLSAPTTTDAPLLLPTTEAHSVLPEPTTTVKSSVLPVSRTSQGPTTLSRSAATQDSSGLSVPPVTDVPLVLPVPSSSTPVLHSTEIPSTLSTSITNCTSKSITSMPVCPVSATQAAPVISPAFVPVSQTGTLTLRICPSGIKSNTIHISSDSKIICSNSGQPNTTDNLNSLRSGSFALLQFSGKKNILSPAVKQVASLESKNNEFSAIKLEENITNSQVVGTVEPKENKLPANQPELHAEKLMCVQNGGTLERANKDSKITLQLVRDADVLSNPTYISEDKKSEEEGMVKRKHVKNPEDTECKVLYSYDTVPENCSGAAVLAHGTLEEKKVEHLKSSYEEQTHCNQAQNADAGIEGAEQTQLDMEKRVTTEWPQESWNKHKVNLDSTKKVVNKLKPLLWETQDPVPLGSNMNEKDNFVVAKRKTEELREKTTSVEVQDNASSNKNLDNGQEFLPKRNPDFQENDKTNRHIKEAADIQEESQTFRQLVPLEYKTSMGADKHVEKFAKCIQQNTLKTSHHGKDSPPIIDITMDDTEKEEKTDDSADEMADEISGYQSEDVVNIETVDESESSGVEEHVDIETVEELSEKINIARLKATATHALLSKELQLVRDHSNKMVAKTTKEPESFSNKKSKNGEKAFANYRQTHTANERRRRKEMRGLFEKLKAALGLQAFPKVSKCFILKQAFEEIQGLTDQADKLKGQKNLLMRKQDTLIRKISSLSGKTQEVVLKKLEYIYAKQKAVEEQKKKQHQQAEPKMICKNIETAKPSVENSSSSLIKEMKPVIESNKRTKPLILSRKGNHVTSMASVMIQLPSSAVPVEVKNILPTSTLPITPSSVASSTATPVVQKAPELTSESEDSFMMPRIVNVTSLATEEDTNFNLDINKNSCVTLHANSQESEPSFEVLSQETAKLPSEGIAEAFPQIVNVSSLKESSASFAAELCTEELSGTKKRVKQMGKGGDGQKSKNSSFQKLHMNVPRDSGLEMELQKVASVIHEPTLDPSDLIDIEESDDADETLTSLLNEIAFLNQQLNDDASDISELPNSLSSGFPLGDMESRQESATTNASPFQFGAMGGTFKGLSVVRESTDSITPLLLHLDDDDLSEGSRKAGEVSAQSDALKLMLRSEVKNPHPDLTAINRDGNRKNVSLTKARSVSPPILQMKTNLEVATTDMGWRPMPKLAPLGLKAANFSLDSEGQNTKMMPVLAPVATKEMKTAEPNGPNLEPKAVLTLASAAKKSK